VKRRLILIAFATAGLLGLTAAPALATHTHVMQVGNGECVIISPNGGEKDVELPLAVFDHNPNVDIAPTADRMHPLHVLVHKGVPGDHMMMEVYGTTAASICADGYVGT
jgi:hypothetical protein